MYTVLTQSCSQRENESYVKFQHTDEQNYSNIFKTEKKKKTKKTCMYNKNYWIF